MNRENKDLPFRFSALLLPKLETGERFYTNFTKDGVVFSNGIHISLNQYVNALKVIYSSVIIQPNAVDVFGKTVEDCVAVFVKE